MWPQLWLADPLFWTYGFLNCCLYFPFRPQKPFRVKQPRTFPSIMLWPIFVVPLRFNTLHNIRMYRNVSLLYGITVTEYISILKKIVSFCALHWHLVVICISLFFKMLWSSADDTKGYHFLDYWGIAVLLCCVYFSCHQRHNPSVCFL